MLYITCPLCKSDMLSNYGVWYHCSNDKCSVQYYTKTKRYLHGRFVFDSEKKLVSYLNMKAFW